MPRGEGGAFGGSREAQPWKLAAAGAWDDPAHSRRHPPSLFSLTRLHCCPCHLAHAVGPIPAHVALAESDPAFPMAAAFDSGGREVR